MSIVRTAAQKISGMVVRYSSAGNKEWAEGLAREVDFIKSDWGALLWSIGSLRVLLDRRPAPIRTYDDLEPLIKKFEESIRTTRAMLIVTAFSVLLSWLDFSIAKSSSGHIGFAMIAMSWTAMGIQSFLEWRVKEKILKEKNLRNLITYKRDELQQQVKFLRTPKQWFGTLFMTIFMIGTMVWGHSFISRGIVYLFVFLLPLFIVTDVYARRNARRRLQELDALLQTKP